MITSNTEAVVDQFKQYLSQCFHMEDFGVLKYFLGIEVVRNKSRFYLSQRKYVMDIITDTRLLGAKPVMFPLNQNHRLALSNTPLISDPESYRRLIGRIDLFGCNETGSFICCAHSCKIYASSVKNIGMQLFGWSDI